MSITGYGNIAPKTFWGRLVCIAYAVLGIPLMLLMLANIGEITANVFRYAYVNVCCCACDCFRRRVITRRRGRRPTSARHADETEAWKNRFNREQTGRDGATSSSDVSVVDDIEDDDDEDDEQKISVPLTVTIGMLGGFIFMGALLFGVLEGWDWLTSAYCCFVTISTIGFGDVVPGSENFDTTVGQLKMLVAAVYMVFGMALLSMAFNLIQEEMVGKFKWLGTKLGIVKRDDDDDDLDDYRLNRPQYLDHTDVFQSTSTTSRWSTVPRPQGCVPEYLDHAKVVHSTSTTGMCSRVPRPHRGGPQYLDHRDVPEYLDHAKVVHSTSTTKMCSRVPRSHRRGPQYLDRQHDKNQ